MISLARRDGRPLRIGHRGAPALAPENTVRSFRAARDAGVDLIEFDVLQLPGGELVVVHSTDLREVTHGVLEGDVGKRRLEELREVAPELPILDEALRFFVEEAPEVGVHADLKSGGAVEPLVASLQRFGLAERAFVSTTNRHALRAVVRIEPKVRTGITFPPGSSALQSVAGIGLRSVRWATPPLVGLLLARSQSTALVLHHLLVTPRAVRRAHARAANVVAWTVDDPRDLTRVVEAGVDAVVTNDPRIFASTLPS